MYSISEIQAFVARTYAKPDGSPRRMSILPYGYTLTFAALAQNGSGGGVINIQANGDFICFGIRHRVNIGAAQNVSTKTAPFIRVLITDSGTAQQLTAQAVDLENYSQNDAKENPLPYPRIMSGKSSQTVTLTNYSPGGGETYSGDIFLSGILVQEY